MRDCEYYEDCGKEGMGERLFAYIKNPERKRLLAWTSSAGWKIFQKQGVLL